jgi:hypothetical protein
VGAFQGGDTRDETSPIALKFALDEVGEFGHGDDLCHD